MARTHKRRLLSRLSYANVVATVALFLALSTGGAWAASTLISGSKIKRGTITGKQIKDGSLSGVDLAKASVTAHRLAAGVLTQGAKGDAGAKGDTGPKGDTGQKGDTGDRGPSDEYYCISRRHARSHMRAGAGSARGDMTACRPWR
jgi:hypothetical protein